MEVAANTMTQEEIADIASAFLLGWGVFRNHPKVLKFVVAKCPEITWKKMLDQSKMMCRSWPRTHHEFSGSQSKGTPFVFFSGKPVFQKPPIFSRRFFFIMFTSNLFSWSFLGTLFWEKIVQADGPPPTRSLPPRGESPRPARRPGGEKMSSLKLPFCTSKKRSC